jgi:hypothetical protein
MCPLNAYSFPAGLIRFLSLEFLFAETNGLADNETVGLSSRSV